MKNPIVCTASEAINAIKPNSQIAFGHAVAAPEGIAKSLYEHREKVENVKIFHMLYFGTAYHVMPEMDGHVTMVSNFLEGNTRPAYYEKRGEYLPCHFHEVPRLFDKDFPLDIAVVQVSEPNAEGFCSFGVSSDYTKPAAEKAKIIIAEMNKQMPFIGGDNLIHESELDYIIPTDRPIVEIPTPQTGEIEKRIGAHCASLIKDGDTLQVGIGAIPDAVLSLLTNHKDIGIHTEMFTDGVVELMKKGVITGRRKTLHPNKLVSTLTMGSKGLYEFIDNNPDIEFYPVDYINDPYIIGKNDNLISINSCLEVDLFGQAASESIGINQFSGTGGQVDYLRGSRCSKGGISILALRSTAKNGQKSRIVPFLEKGATVTAGRNEVDFIVTEYGIAQLRGRTLRQRAQALISIAHPDFREDLKIEYNNRF